MLSRGTIVWGISVLLIRQDQTFSALLLKIPIVLQRDIPEHQLRKELESNKFVIKVVNGITTYGLDKAYKKKLCRNSSVFEAIVSDGRKIR